MVILPPSLVDWSYITVAWTHCSKEKYPQLQHLPYPTEYPGSVLVEASVLQCVRYCCCLSMLVTPMAWYGYTRTLALSVRGTHYISRYLLRGVGTAFCTGLVGGLAVGCYDTNSKYDKSESGIAAMINDSYLMKIDVEHTQWAVTTITFAFVFAVILLLFYEPAAGHNISKVEKALGGAGFGVVKGSLFAALGIDKTLTTIPEVLVERKKNY